VNAELAAWLLARVPGLVAPLESQTLAAGRSNVSMIVTDTVGRRIVVRRFVGSASAAGRVAVREDTVLRALARTDVPVPDVLARCDDPEVVGEPFLVQSFVDGRVLDSPALAADLTHDARRASAFALVDALASLHTLDLDALGLRELAPQQDFFERQLHTWSRVWIASATRSVPEVEELERRLRRATPSAHAPALVHGDFRFGNAIVDASSGALRAVLDWELCTIGDPLADLGYLRAWWADGVPYDPTAGGGFPSFCELRDRYASTTGFDVGGIAFYIAFSWWRLAVINESVLRRVDAGAVRDATARVKVLSSATSERANRGLAALEASPGSGDVPRVEPSARSSQLSE